MTGRFAMPLDNIDKRNIIYKTYYKNKNHIL
jgi:hypothetical protein